MIRLPVTLERYQEILDALLEPHLRVKLSSNPTTLGSQYICDKIVEILTAKSIVNELMEEVERAYSKIQVIVNDLEAEQELRTDLEWGNLADGELLGLRAAGCHALIRQKVESAYSEDLRLNMQEGEETPGPFQFWEDLKLAHDWEIQLKSLLKILDRRREELSRLDSGVRLQQKTIEMELRIHKNPLSQQINSKPQQKFNGVIPHTSVDPDGGEEDQEDTSGEDTEEEDEEEYLNSIATQISEDASVD